MTISAVPTNNGVESGDRLIDGALINQIIAQLNLAIAALNAGGGGGVFTNLTVSGDTALGDAVTDHIGLFGAAAIVQPAGASQAAVATGAITPLVTTAATNVAPFGFAGAPQADAIATQVNLLITRVAANTALVNALRLALVGLGAVKGAA